MIHKILLIDDDNAILKSLHRLLRTLNIDLYTSNSAAEALTLCEKHDFTLILSDQHMPHMNGTQLLARIKNILPDSTRIIVSAYSDFGAITEAFNEGVIHKFISKPWDNEDFRFVVKSVISENENIIEENTVDNYNLIEFHGIYTQCDEMLSLFDMIKRVATANVPVNICGPTGTGKELVAKALHKESNRKNKKFLAVNCANLSPELAESQLFGHRKGSFTSASSDAGGLLAAANGGTLFLDEVTCLALPVQVKLLRALQEREYYQMGATEPAPFDVQVISASSKSIKQAVEDGEFRDDLRFRLEVIPLQIPLLKDRGDDVIEIFKLFIQQLREGKEISISPEAVDCILAHTWPGNVRELFNAASYAHTMAEGSVVYSKNLPIDIQSPTFKHVASSQVKFTNTPPPAEEQILNALEKYKGNRSKSAESLGISRMTLWRKMKQLNMC